MRRVAISLLSALLLVGGCGGEPADDATGDGSTALGPVDGRDLPGSDLERVQTGQVAPDFSLVSLAGPVVTLSDFRGSKNVVLVFYRGWW